MERKIFSGNVRNGGRLFPSPDGFRGMMEHVCNNRLDSRYVSCTLLSGGGELGKGFAETVYYILNSEVKVSYKFDGRKSANGRFFGEASVSMDAGSGRYMNKVRRAMLDSIEKKDYR